MKEQLKNFAVGTQWLLTLGGTLFFVLLLVKVFIYQAPVHFNIGGFLFGAAVCAWGLGGAIRHIKKKYIL